MGVQRDLVNSQREHILQVVHANRGKRAYLFGSAARGEDSASSDVDLLVEYLPGRHPGLMLFRQQDELAERFRRPADLHTPASLSRHFRDEILATAVPIYEQA